MKHTKRGYPLYHKKSNGTETHWSYIGPESDAYQHIPYERDNGGWGDRCWEVNSKGELLYEDRLEYDAEGYTVYFSDYENEECGMERILWVDFLGRVRELEERFV